jgi:type I restriction enzyme S subunit
MMLPDDSSQIPWFHQTAIWIQRNSMRSGQPGVNAQEYSSLKFTLPSLEEQQKIASFLSSLDNKIEALNKQISMTQQFKKGLLQQMFVYMVLVFALGV